MSLKKAFLMSSIALGSFSTVQKASAQGGIGQGTPVYPEEQKNEIMHYDQDVEFDMYDLNDDENLNLGWSTIWMNPGVLKTKHTANHPYYHRFISNEDTLRDRIDKKMWKIGSHYTFDMMEERVQDGQFRLHFSSIHATSYQEPKRDPNMLRNMYQYPNYWARGQRDVRYVATYQDSDNDGRLTQNDKLVSQTLIINVPEAIDGKTYHMQTIMHINADRPTEMGVGAFFLNQKDEMVNPPNRPAANTAAIITSYESEKRVTRIFNNTVDQAGNLSFDDAKAFAHHMYEMLEKTPEAPSSSDAPKPKGP